MLAAPPILLGAVFAVQLVQANRVLAALAGQPPQACGDRYRPLPEIRQRDQDASVVHHVLYARGYGGPPGLGWHFGRLSYDVAARVLTSAAERRDLFARLDCPVRGVRRRGRATI